MKKIINGKKYDTETATYIAGKSWWNDSVNYEQSEEFYKKKTGEFFRYEDKKTTWGNIYNYEKLIPINESEARKALEDLLTIAEYEALFGAVEE